ncbi:hypothetical protein BDW69DRAFT_180544 [Aspergillus filifer]
MPRRNSPKYRLDTAPTPPYQLLEANNSLAPPPAYPDPEPVIEPPMKLNSPLGFTRMLEKIGHGKERYEWFRGRKSSVSTSTSAKTRLSENVDPDAEDWNLSIGLPRETPPEGYDFVLVLHGQKSKKCLWTYTVADGSNGWNKVHTEFPGSGSRFDSIFHGLQPASSKDFMFAFFLRASTGEDPILKKRVVVETLQKVSKTHLPRKNENGES